MTSKRKITIDDLTPEGYAENPFNVFAIGSDGIATLAVDLSGVTKKQIRKIRNLTDRIPLSLAIAHFHIARREKRGMATHRRGLAILEEAYGREPVGDIRGQDIEDLEDRFVGEASERLELLNHKIGEIEDPFVRARCEQALLRMGTSPGEGAYRNFLYAVVSLNKYLGKVMKFPYPMYKGIDIPKSRTGSRHAASEEQLIALYKATARLRPCDQEIALTVLDFVRETGARSVSVQQLNLEDINWQAGVVTIRGKRGVVHVAPLSQDLLRRLALLAAQRWDGVTPKGYNPEIWSAVGTPAFVNAAGNRLTKQWITNLFDQLDKIVRDIDSPRITCHVLRHTTLTQVERLRGRHYARSWANHRPDGREGDDTARYTKVTIEERIDVLNEMFPEFPHGGWDPIHHLPVMRRDTSEAA